jgi:hypothetical protein
MSGQRVSTGIYLGDKLVKPIFGNQFMGVNPFFQPDPTPVLTNSIMMLDATSATSYPGTGNTWTDLSGNGNNADVSLVTSYWNAGGYFDWPGTDYTKIATVADAASLDIFGSSSNWTLMFAGSVDATAGGLAGIAGPFAMNDWTDNPGIGWLFWRDTGDANYKKMQLYTNATAAGFSNNTVWSTTGEFLVLHIVKSGGNTITYYNTSNTNIGSHTNTTNANNNNGIVIGRGRNEASFNYKWDGKIAGIGYYNTALTSDQRLQNINYFKDKLGF